MSEPAERKPFLVRAGEGESVWSLGGRFTAKATAAVTEGRFALVESVAFQSTEPPWHIHHREDEAWYILDGKMTFYVGDAVLEAAAGCFAFAPRGIPHTFTVDVEPTRVLVFASPAGFEHFALELGEQARDDTPPAGLAVPGPEVLGPVAERYGIEVVGPPPRGPLTALAAIRVPRPAVGGCPGRPGDARGLTRPAYAWQVGPAHAEPGRHGGGCEGVCGGGAACAFFRRVAAAATGRGPVDAGGAGGGGRREPAVGQ